MNKYKIATIGSHTTLQILKGAKEEGFSTIAICKREMIDIYRRFGVADKIIEIDDYPDFLELGEALKKENAIVIPHASFVAYIDLDKLERMNIMYFGNRKILKWESDRNLEREFLNRAGLKTPLIFKRPEDIDRAVIIKLFGARGGKGYFVVNNEVEFKEKIKAFKDTKYIIQEYIVGVPLYAHYFYSRMNKELEIMGFDKRYESNLDFYIFELSARIVAGTNPFIDGSPYSYIKYGQNVSTGRRIAMEINQAINENR